MPRHPGLAPSVLAMQDTLFSALAHRLATYRGEIYPLHVGDTWMEPPTGCRMEDLTEAEFPGMHRYTAPHGWPPLLDAVVERVRATTGEAVDRGNVFIAAGATGGLGAAIGATVAPGEEVLVPAPHWPLIVGIVRTMRGEPVVVPLDAAVDDPDAAVACLEARCSERTAALYLSTPNNPSGKVFRPAVVEALVAWAAAKGLWIYSDEVYEQYAYEGAHTYARPLAPERTFAVYSFSKAYGMAGNRCGYVVGPAAEMKALRKVSTHSVYNAPTAGQIAGRRALDGAGAAWVAVARDRYATAGRAAAARLGVPAPEGGTFLWVDVADALAEGGPDGRGPDGRGPDRRGPDRRGPDRGGLAGLLDAAADRGLFLAPGPSFGPYPTHVRLCFTSAPPDVVDRGVAVLASLLGRAG